MEKKEKRKKNPQDQILVTTEKNVNSRQKSDSQQDKLFTVTRAQTSDYFKERISMQVRSLIDELTRTTSVYDQCLPARS